MKKNRSAFTIIELLVAVAVTSILVSLIITMTVNVLNVWNRSSGMLGTGNQARVILDQLGQDLQSAVFRRDIQGAQWLVATIQPDTALSGMSNEDWSTGTSKPASTSGSLDLSQSYTANTVFTDARFGQRGLWLRFFSDLPNSNTAAANFSGPVAVAYQLVRRKQGGSASDVPVYQMYRSQVGTQQTFASGYNITSAASYASGASPGSTADPEVIRQPNAAQLIGNNVIDFGIRFYNSAGAVIFPSAAGDRIFTAAVSAVGSDVVAFPDSAEVFVRVLTDEGLRQIQALEAGQITGNWWTIALANSNVYSRRVQFKTSVL